MTDTMTAAAVRVDDQGRVYDTAVGELVVFDETGNVTLGAALEAYARARLDGALAAGTVRDMQDAALADLEEQPDYVEALSDLGSARARQADIEGVLGALFGDRVAAVTVETDAVRCEWPAPEVTWTLAHPARWYAGTAARRELSELVNAIWGEENGYGPTTIGRVVGAVLKWLCPTVRWSEPGPLEITVHAVRGGGQ